MAAKPIYPHDLETQYSENFSRFIDDINHAFLDLILEEFEKSDAEFVKESVTDSGALSRTNALPIGALRKKMAGMFDKFLKSDRYKAIFKSAESIFRRADSQIIAGVQKQYERQASKGTAFPDLKQKPSKAVEAAIELNVNLIKDITTKQFNELEKTVVQAVSGRATLEQTTESVMTTFKSGRAYAVFVARDQLSKAHAAISMERQIDAGFPGYIWTATNDFKTRESHKKQHGKFHLWDEPPLVDGRNLHPGEDYQCRCIAVPAFGPAKATPRTYTTFDDAYKKAKTQKHQSFAELRRRGEM